MTSRITIKDLNTAVLLLNEALNRPTEPYSTLKLESSTFSGTKTKSYCNPGNLYLESWGGRVGLVEMTKGSGAKEIFYKSTKRELFCKINAMRHGVDLAKNTVWEIK